MKCPVYELALPNGFGYVRVLKTHPVYGEILSVDPTRYGTALLDPSGTVLGQTVIFPLTATRRSGAIQARPIGDVPTKAHETLQFKFAVRDNTGQPIYWWLWDGNTIEIANSEHDLTQIPERRVSTPQEILAIWR